MTRSQKEFTIVLDLIAQGTNDCEISRRTRIPRATVRDWRVGKCDQTQRDQSHHGCPGGHDYSTLSAAEYSYLLGMYLGDGCLSEHPRGVYRLRIVSDAQYPGIIEECCRAMEAVIPGKRAYRQPRPSRCFELSMYSKHWLCLFPQHGPGRKHGRMICLYPWQEKLLEQATESFVRGLIHSDGCRVVANDRGVMSVRYHFSNRSEDIKRIFCAALDSLDIPWTRPCDKQIAIYRKAATARLDEFIGPKE